MAMNLGWTDLREVYGNAQQAQNAMQAAQQQVQLQNQYAMAQQQAMMNNAAAQMSGISGLAQGGYVTQPTPQYDKTFGNMFTTDITLPTLEELDDPDSAFNLPLEALATMWGARFGYRWVPDESTTAALEENESMWRRVVKRLFDAGMLMHQQYRRPDSDQIKVAWKLVEKDHGNS